MLDILRKKASSWITKFLLGLVAVVFIFFFGYTGLRQGTGKATVAAHVDGAPIFQNEVDRIVQNQMEYYRRNDKEEIPEALAAQMRENAVGALIEDRIVRAEAERLGLRVSDGEIYQKLSTDPNVQVEGKFDPEHYRNVFRPWFLNRTGIDYEEILARELLKEKFTALFTETVVVSDLELKDSLLLDRTKIRVKSIEINPANLAVDYKPAEEAIGKKVDEMKKKGAGSEDEAVLKQRAQTELITLEGKNRAELLASKLWSVYSSGRSVAGKLKENNLSEKENPLVGIDGAESLFGGQFDPPAIAALFRLTKKKPFPPSPLRVGNLIYFFKLVSKEEPNPADIEKTGEEEREKFRKETGYRFYRLWYSARLEKAKIKINK